MAVASRSLCSFGLLLCFFFTSRPLCLSRRDCCSSVIFCILLFGFSCSAYANTLSHHQLKFCLNQDLISSSAGSRHELESHLIISWNLTISWDLISSSAVISPSAAISSHDQLESHHQLGSHLIISWNLTIS
ncbi:hypothetical protein L2E82_44761 [Cichorium intybus]|uniref:Uncharacterized protein n=1 Tax=Cichorium intybus TaxID=13427 RepID=A0ACB8ZSF1_CICIN|nr:hypothetical protein L2E82_44761 [Cichorium intybus]